MLRSFYTWIIFNCFCRWLFCGWFDSACGFLFKPIGNHAFSFKNKQNQHRLAANKYERLLNRITYKQKGVLQKKRTVDAEKGENEEATDPEKVNPMKRSKPLAVGDIVDVKIMSRDPKIKCLVVEMPREDTSDDDESEAVQGYLPLEECTLEEVDLGKRRNRKSQGGQSANARPREVLSEDFLRRHRLDLWTGMWTPINITDNTTLDSSMDMNMGSNSEGASDTVTSTTIASSSAGKVGVSDDPLRGNLPAPITTFKDLPYYTSLLSPGHTVSASYRGSVTIGTSTRMVYSLRPLLLKMAWQYVLCKAVTGQTMYARVMEVTAEGDALVRILYGRTSSPSESTIQEDIDSDEDYLALPKYASTGLLAIVPSSQLVSSTSDASIVGSILRVRALDYDPEDGQLVCSETLATTTSDRAGDTADSSYEVGSVVTATISATKPYGCLVMLGDNASQGLLHVSQMSADKVSDVNAVFAIGEEIWCQVVEHDRVTGRIAVSTKALETVPGEVLRNKAEVFRRAKARLSEEAVKGHSVHSVEDSNSNDGGGNGDDNSLDAILNSILRPNRK